MSLMICKSFHSNWLFQPGIWAGFLMQLENRPNRQSNWIRFKKGEKKWGRKCCWILLIKRKLRKSRWIIQIPGFFNFCFLNYTHVRIEQIFVYRVKHAYISRIPLERFNTSDKGETISTRGFILVRVIDVDRDYRADELEQILVLDVDRTRSRNRSRVWGVNAPLSTRLVLDPLLPDIDYNFLAVLSSRGRTNCVARPA